YGFRDAFNLKANWWGPDVIGIDQGPIIIMAENYRTERIWQVFMRNTEIHRGLQRAGFSPVTEVADSYHVLPKHYTLEQNYPNPFNPSTEICYGVPKDAWVTIRVFDLLGRYVMTLVNEYKKAGNHSVRLDGSSLSSGVYFYRMSANGTTLVRKMMVLK
ncbi:MAG: glucoamylase family protein, partial [Bacteroidota bacterium]